MNWIPFDDGATIGQQGSEDGRIISDEEYDCGARITLERGGRAAPAAITCGVYGWAFHTRFFSGEAEARGDYDAMKAMLAGIVRLIPRENDPDRERKSKAVVRAISDFVAKYP